MRIAAFGSAHVFVSGVYYKIILNKVIINKNRSNVDGSYLILYEVVIISNLLHKTLDYIHYIVYNP